MKLELEATNERTVVYNISRINVSNEASEADSLWQSNARQ